MAAHQQRHELIAQVLGCGRVAVLIALAQQQRQHRGAVVGLAAPAGQQFVEQRVEALDRNPEPPPRAPRAQVLHHHGHGQHPGQGSDACQGPLHRGAELGELALVAGPEDDPEHDLQRERAHALQRVDGAVPGGELGARQLADHGSQRPHLLAVKRLLQQPPLAQVLVAVDDEDRVGAGERAQELPALPGGRDRRGQGEHLAHGVGSAEQHHRLFGPIRADRGRVAEAPVHALQEGAGAAHPSQRLPQRGRARSRRQCANLFAHCRGHTSHEALIPGAVQARSRLGARPDVPVSRRRAGARQARASGAPHARLP